MPTLFSPRSATFARPMSVDEAARADRPSGGPAGHSTAARFPFALSSYGRRLHFDLRVDTGNLPLGTRLVVAFPLCPVRSGQSSLIGFERLEQGGGSVTMALVIGPHTAMLHPGISGLVPTADFFEASLTIELPSTARPGRYVLGVEHWIGNSLMGGRAFSLAVASGQAA